MTAFIQRRGVMLIVALVLTACQRERAGARVDGPIVVRDAWARAADSGATSGAYFALANHDTTDVTIDAVTSPSSTGASLHETMLHDGMAHMVARPAIAIPRDSTLVLTPGGLHVMLPELTRALRAGDTVRLALTLNDGRRIPVAAVVRAP